MAEFLPTFCNFALNRSSEVIEVSNPMFWGMGNSFPQSELQYLKQFPRWSKMVDFWPLIACIMITILNIAIVHIIKSLLEWQGTQCNNHTITAYRFFFFFFFFFYKSHSDFVNLERWLTYQILCCLTQGINFWRLWYLGFTVFIPGAHHLVLSCQKVSNPALGLVRVRVSDI